MAETSKSGAKRRTRRRLKKANKALVEVSTGCGAFMWMHYNPGTSFHAGFNPALRSSLEGRNFVSRLVEIEARLHQAGLQATGLEVLEAFLRGPADEEASTGSVEWSFEDLSFIGARKLFSILWQTWEGKSCFPFKNKVAPPWWPANNPFTRPSNSGRSKEQNLQTISALLEILPRKKAYYCFMEKSKSLKSTEARSVEEFLKRRL
ncbi:hypothetical protein BSKO_05889 [Bryopsis sp. KO-2023]|nr:hypothetical protein BSKO_05889 [Bryopsis sp. KO-2023]